MVGIIDEAFISRIHVSLRYPRVDLETTLAIWRNFFHYFKTKYASRDVQPWFEEDKLLRFAKEHYEKHAGSKSTWNGWQIRNAFQTAIALGETARRGRDYMMLKVEYFEELAAINPGYDSEDPDTVRHKDTGSAKSHISTSKAFESARRKYGYREYSL